MKRFTVAEYNEVFGSIHEIQRQTRKPKKEERFSEHVKRKNIDR